MARSLSRCGKPVQVKRQVLRECDGWSRHRVVGNDRHCIASLSTFKRRLKRGVVGPALDLSNRRGDYVFRRSGDAFGVNGYRKWLGYARTNISSNWSIGELKKISSKKMKTLDKILLDYRETLTIPLTNTKIFRACVIYLRKFCIFEA